MEVLSLLFDSLKKYVSRISWLFTLLETAIALLLGGLVGAQISGQDHWKALAVTAVVYLALLIAKFATQRLFPTAVVEELKSKRELELTEKQLARRDTLSGFIEHSITELNVQTCAISSETSPELCSQDLEQGLGQVLEPLISRTHYLCDCNASAFLVACFVTYQAPEPKGYVREYIVFRDDLAVGGMLKEDLLKDYTLKGSELDLQKVLQKAFNENALADGSFIHNGKTLRVSASPIPSVCDTSEADGLIILILPGCHSWPSDLGSTLRIFGTIVANWLSKYSECVANREDKKNENKTGGEQGG
jgi:hypothetical protein